MPETLLLGQLLTPYEQANLQNSAELANIDILATDLIPIQTIKREAREAATGVVVAGEITAPCLFRIQICVDGAAIFRAMIIKDGNTQPFNFNDNTDLTADAGYMFDLLVHDGDTINFRLSADVTIRNLRVQEIKGGVQ